MRRITLILAMAALALALAPLHALAQTNPPGELGILLGVSRLDRDVVGPGQKPDWSPVLGLRLGANMDRETSYFLEGLYGRFDTNINGDKSEIFEARGGLERNFPLGSGHCSWYLAGAVGWADANRPAVLGDFGRPLVSAGIGLKGPSGRMGRLHAEVREEWWLGDEGMGGADVANTQVLLGLGFGLSPKSARKPLFERGRKSLVLEGVNFVTNSAELTHDSEATLDRVAESLRDWGRVKVEIEGHTDNVDDDAYNMTLSQRRAESVREYLVRKGIAPSRLTARGYGETRPIASNETEAGRAKNRRVELRKTN